jgi:hypothetical protein
MKYEHNFINSSMLSSCSYDDAEHEMTVVFSNGKSYTYAEVAFNTYMDLVNAPSAGKYFNQIKSGLKAK